MVTERLGIERESEVEELREAIAARDELLAVMGHELRNSMSPLVLLISMFEEMQVDDAMKPRIAMLSRNLKTFRDVLDRVSEVTALREGKLVLQREPVALDEVVREVIRETNADVWLETARVNGEWDRGRVKQIVHHLLTNALQHGAAPVQVTVREHGQSAELVVHDGGPGIPPEMRDRVFQRFKHTNGQRRSRGLGVGLWVVDQLCRAMGGSVRLLESERGARFSVLLPR